MLLKKSKLTNILNTTYLSVHNNRIKTEPTISATHRISCIGGEGVSKSNFLIGQQSVHRLYIYLPGSIVVCRGSHVSSIG